MSDRSILSTIKDAILNVKTVILCVIFTAYQLFGKALFVLIFARDTWSLTASVAEKLIAAWRGLIIWICLFTVLTAVIMRKWKWKQWLITLPLQFVLFTLVCFLWRVLVPYYPFPTATPFVLPTVFDTIDFAFHTQIYSFFYSLAIFDYIFFLASCIEIFALQALGIHLYNRWSERRERRAMRAKEAKEAEKRSNTEQNKTPAPSEEDNKD